MIFFTFYFTWLSMSFEWDVDNHHHSLRITQFWEPLMGPELNEYEYHNYLTYLTANCNIELLSYLLSINLTTLNCKYNTVWITQNYYFSLLLMLFCITK